jgi:hypothetical protein
MRAHELGTGTCGAAGGGKGPLCPQPAVRPCDSLEALGTVMIRG